MANLNTTEYAYIIPPSAQFNDENGKPYSAGFVEFYRHGTSEKYNTYADWNGSLNPFRIPLNSQGRAVAIVPKDVFLDMYVYNYLGNLAYSRLNVNYVGEGGFTSNGLVRGIVAESDNVHVRSTETLSDGTQIYGVSVDEDLWIAHAIAPNEWVASQETSKGVLRWYNKNLYYHLTGTNTEVPPNEDTENWKFVTIDEFLKSFDISWGKLIATSTSEHGIGPWTKTSGSIKVTDGYLQLESEKIYHFTLKLAISNSTYNANYDSGYITVDEDNYITQPEFQLDGSRRSNVVEVSWDGAATREDLMYYLAPTLPEGYNVVRATLWVHSINNTTATGGGSVAVDNELSLDSTNPVENRAVTAALNTKANSADLAPIATSGSWNDLENVPTDLVKDPNYVHTDENFTANEKSKLGGIQAGAEVNIQADWNQTDSTADDYIKNKPQDFVRDPSYVHTDNNFTNADKSKLDGIEAGAEKNVNADWNAASGDAAILNKPANLVQDPDYVHTDNNFTTAEKNKLSGIENGAEKNVNADWNATSGDSEILNKPENLVQDPNYVHTDNNFTSADKDKLDGIEAGAEKNVQSDWNQTDASADDYIKNKPTIETLTYTTDQEVADILNDLN